jgi:hypothetical protein
MAVTPLSAVIGPPTFEVQFLGHGFVAPLRVVLDDRTGLVVALHPSQSGRHEGVENDPASGRILVVSLFGGCGDRLTRLTLERVESGFRIEERTSRGGCSFLIGITRTVAIHLRVPVDAASVQLQSVDR